MTELSPADVDKARNYVRGIESKLDATPPGTPGRTELMRHVHEWRGAWRRAEEQIGRRAAGMAVQGNRVNPLDMAKLSTLTKGLRKAAQRNTGRPISGDIKDFEERVDQNFGRPPGQTG